MDVEQEDEQEEVGTPKEISMPTQGMLAMTVANPPTPTLDHTYWTTGNATTPVRFITPASFWIGYPRSLFIQP